MCFVGRANFIDDLSKGVCVQNSVLDYDSYYWPYTGMVMVTIVKVILVVVVETNECHPLEGQDPSGDDFNNRLPNVGCTKVVVGAPALSGLKYQR